MKKLILIEGMGCQNCVKHVTEALENISGVNKVNVSLEKNNAVVEYSGEISDEVFKTAIDEAGYNVTKIETA